MAGYREDFKKELVDLYEFGFTAAELSEMSGVGRNTILNWVRKFKKDVRPVGENIESPDKADINEIVKLRDENEMSWPAIANRLDLTANAVRKRYYRYKSKNK